MKTLVRSVKTNACKNATNSSIAMMPNAIATGSPAMNQLRGTLRHDGHWRLITAHGEITLDEPADPAVWQAWRDSEVVLGVRPEDLQPLEAGPPALHARLEVLEPVGNEVFLNLRYGDQTLVSRVAPRNVPAAGADVPLSLAAGRVHLFDAANGVRIAT